MNKDLIWEQYLENIRQEIDDIEKKQSNMHMERRVLKYMASHPKSGNLSDLMNINGDEAKGKALLRYRTGVLNDCFNYDKLESCNILECLYCENSVYEIMLESGNGIKKGERDIESYHNDHTKNIDNEYEIWFYDIIPTEDELFSYLFDEESRYKIIRKVDNEEIVDATFKIRSNHKTKKTLSRQRNTK